MVTGRASHLPRLVITAPASGQGKTTVATGLMAALRAEGLEVAGFKVGPDYIDPGFHALATGRPGRNLDPQLCGEELVAPLLLHGAATPRPADLAVVEGVLGLHDGRIGGDGFGSTAHVASLIAAPVVVVVDISAMARTAAAVLQGLIGFEPGLRFAGAILNRAGSARHAREVRTALEDRGVPVLGMLPRDAGIEAPARHLGLVPAAERPDAAAAVARLGRQVAEHVCLTELLAAAHTAPPLPAEAWEPGRMVRPASDRRPVVAIAGGRAFSFCYPETAELLRAAGCEPVTFDPATDPALPPGTAGLYLGGGFPEVHAAALTANRSLRAEIRDRVAAGLPTVAECAGLLYLCRTLDGQPMVEALDATATMTDRLALGYRTAVAPADQLVAVAGTRVSAHEFHKTTVDPDASGSPAWLVDGRPAGFAADPAGTGTPTLHASYLHVHWAGHPHLAQRFADAVHAWPAADPDPDLDHHGDRDVAAGLVDLAVNVRLPGPPPWLAAVITETVSGLGSYPCTDEAVRAVATAHSVEPAGVLPTAGAAEAFSLLARAAAWRCPVVVHPQFTEPEAALRAAGHQVRRVLLSPRDGFLLHPDRVPAEADLVVIGNPTNPTSVLHPAADLRRLARAGRVLVVDEAFMDAVPGEPESLAGSGLPGLVVLRSLTKTWGLAGLRAGYAVGDPEPIAALRAQQPPWSVSSPALAATVACLSPAARALAAEAAAELGPRRDLLTAELADLGLPVSGTPAGPFVLVDTARWPGPAGRVRSALRAAGFAVRRGDSFPGLGPAWVRITVRDAATTRALGTALRVIKERAACA